MAEIIKQRISHHSLRLNELSNTYDNKRIRKRILQTLGKLNKELQLFDNKNIINNKIDSNISNNDDLTLENDSKSELHNGYDDINKDYSFSHNKIENLSNSQIVNKIDNKIVNKIDNKIDNKKLTNKQMKLKVKLLNDELQKCSINKQLKKAIKLFNNSIKKQFNLSIHTYTNLLNVFVRCNHIAGAERLLNQMIITNNKPNNITLTILLKGYCDNGLIKKSIYILDNLYNQLDIYPNIRTINTLLRGCKRYGYIDNAIDIYNKYINISDMNSNIIEPDLTTYSYYIQIVSQKLDINIVNNFLINNAITLSNDLDELIINKYISIYLSISTMYTLLGSIDQSIKYMRIIEQIISKNHNLLSKLNNSKNLFFQFQKNEYVLKYKYIDKYITNYLCNKSNVQTYLIIQLLDKLSKLFYFDYNENFNDINDFNLSNGLSDNNITHLPITLSNQLTNTKDNISIDECTVINNIMKSLINKFGLNNIPIISTLITKFRKEVSKKVICSFNFKQLNFKHIFQLPKYIKNNLKYTMNDQVDKPLRLEIGSGLGDWIIDQALNDIDTYWIALELRCDRVYEIFCKSIMYKRNIHNQDTNQSINETNQFEYNQLSKYFDNSISNLSIIGGDARVIVPNHLPKNSFTSIYINYPQPPERTSGINDSQGEHLLTIEFMNDLYDLLLDESHNLTIVSDNLLYLKSLCDELVRYNTKCINIFHKSSTYNEDDNIRKRQRISTQISSFKILYSIDLTNHPIEISYQLPNIENDSVNKVINVYKGEFNIQSNGLINSDSYFNRLWNNNNQTNRWFIHLQKLKL